MSKLVVLNGSYHRAGVTARCLNAVAKKIPFDFRKNIFIANDLMSCVGCGPGKCIPGCNFKDQFQEIAGQIQTADYVLIGSPVYLDMPTAKLVALLTRLNCYAESTNREFFRGKRVHIHANGYCSGTKAVIRTIMGACEMLGFTVDGRSTTEYVELWKDKKIRGGMDSKGCLLT
jgi:multimeric flavodoxin WrbA